MKKILVVDDEEWLREMIQLALRQKGYEVIEAENGAVGHREGAQVSAGPRALRCEHGQGGWLSYPVILAR